MRGSQSSYRLVGSVIAAGALLGATELARSGDLGPPSGAVTPTMKTLDEIEPRIAINDVNTPGDADTMYIINLPGSYYLTERIIGPGGFDGIEVTARGVTLDLNGFDMVGQPGSGVAIAFTTNAKGGTVRNGSIRLWGGGGVDMRATTSAVKGVRVRGAGFGITIANGLISECVAEECDDFGIAGGGSSVIIDSVARANGDDGIVFGNGSVVSRCVSGNNTGDGFSGSHSTLAECSSYENGAHGYRIGLASIARGCGARLNTGSGFFLQRASQLVECSSYGDARTGIEAADFTTIRACTIDLSNGLGITAATGTVIEQCTISACENGIDQLEGSTDMIVRGCRVTSNVGWGIRARDRSLIEGNHVTDNGVTSPAYFDGILIMGQDNVIRQNVMIGNDRAKMDLGVDNLWVDNIEQNNVALP